MVVQDFLILMAETQLQTKKACVCETRMPPAATKNKIGYF